MLIIFLIVNLSLSTYSSSSCDSEEVFWLKHKDDLFFINKVSEEKESDHDNPDEMFLRYGYKRHILLAKVYINQKRSNMLFPLNEASTIEKFHHNPYIIKMKFCYYTENSVKIFIEELGGNLSVQRRKFFNQPLTKQITQLIQLSNTFNEMHRRGYIHGDIKSRNLVFSKNRRYIKIIDFGFSVMIGDKTMGHTEFYSAPELLNDNKEDIDAESSQDCWSWVLTIIYLLVPKTYRKMRIVFYEEKSYHYTMESIKLMIDELEIYSIEWSLPLDKILGPLLQLKPEKRPSMQAISNSLKRLLIAHKNELRKTGRLSTSSSSRRSSSDIDSMIGTPTLSDIPTPTPQLVFIN